MGRLATIIETPFSPLTNTLAIPPNCGHPLHKQRQRLASERRHDGILAGGVRHRENIIDVAGRDVLR